MQHSWVNQHRHFRGTTHHGGWVRDWRARSHIEGDPPASTAFLTIIGRGRSYPLSQPLMNQAASLPTRPLDMRYVGVHSRDASTTIYLHKRNKTTGLYALHLDNMTVTNRSQNYGMTMVHGDYMFTNNKEDQMAPNR